MSVFNADDPPVDLNKCRINGCDHLPTWYCDWDQARTGDLVTLAYCDRDQEAKRINRSLSNWRPIKSHEDAIKEFWEEFAK